MGSGRRCVPGGFNWRRRLRTFVCRRAWTRRRLNWGTERAVALKEAIPVYLTYFTAWEENGDIQVGNDVYGFDARQRTARGL
jgi:murein L,D-transpeptidase YcbB/YkuD